MIIIIAFWSPSPFVDKRQYCTVYIIIIVACGDLRVIKKKKNPYYRSTAVVVYYKGIVCGVVYHQRFQFIRILKYIWYKIKTNTRCAPSFFCTLCVVIDTEKKNVKFVLKRTRVRLPTRNIIFWKKNPL